MKKLMIFAGIILAVTSIAQEYNPPHYDENYSLEYTKNISYLLPTPGKTLYVSPNGSKNSNGSIKKPFGSLDEARDAIRKLKDKKGMPDGGIHIVLLDGYYHFSEETFKLMKQDGGTANSPIVYRAKNKGQVIFGAGQDIPSEKFQFVTQSEQLSRLKPEARGKVMYIDLSDMSMDSYFPGNGKYGQISVDGYLLQLARWPNIGYHHIGEFIDQGPTRRWLKPGEKPMPYTKENPTGGKFKFKEELPELIEREFERSGEMYADGFYHNDWYFQSEAIGGIEDKEIQLLHHTRYGIVDHIKTMPRRIRLVNVLSELDEEGEWYYDKIDKKLYLWPIKNFIPGKSRVTAIKDSEIEINYSFLPVRKREAKTDKALICIDNASYINFQDIVFENTSDLGVYIEGGSYNRIAGCTFRNGTGQGATIEGGEYNGISGSDFYNLYTAFSIKGGEYKTLTPCYNYATNNIIHSCRIRGYGVLTLSGVGLYCAHNLLHDMNGAIMFETVDLLMEYNEFYNIGYEMGDFNVAYCGAQWYTMNNVLRYNFVHHIIEPGSYQIAAFRNDDNGAGMLVYGNMFYRTGTSSTIFHGFLNDFQNNITIGNTFMWWTVKKPIDSVAIQEAWDNLSRFGTELPKGDKGDYIYNMDQILGKDGWRTGVWKERFPELEQTINKNPWAQTNCHVNNNYAQDIDYPFMILRGDKSEREHDITYRGKFKLLPKDEVLEFPTLISLDAFEDISSLNFNFKSSFTPEKWFTPIPFDKIGLYKDQFRQNPPDKSEYRSAVYNKFKDDKKQRYSPEIVNARYPIPAYH